MLTNTGTPRGYFYAPIDTSDSGGQIHQARLFKDKIALLLERKAQILATPEYYFSPLSFCHVCVGIPGASHLTAALRLGHLLVGWERGVLINECNDCRCEVYIVAFGGNLKGSNCWWHGWCQNCKLWLRLPSTSEVTKARADSMRDILKESPEYLELLESYATYCFSWSGDSLMPTTKSRLVTRRLYQPKSFELVIHDLSICK